MLKLIIEDDEGRKTVVPFVRDEITIGRQEGNTIRLTERNVSRRHARLLRQAGAVKIEDLGSSNGIRVNGDRISGLVQVSDGDLIQIGDYDLAIQREEERQAAAAATTPMQLPSMRNGNGSAAPTARLEPRENTPTVPALPAVAPVSDETPPPHVREPETEDEAAPPVHQSTAVIRIDQVQSNRRELVELDSTQAARLVVVNTEFAGREFLISKNETRIGRVDDNDVYLDHRSLSRTHCKLVREDNGEWRVIDMQSANGLMVNGEPYAQVTLRSGDVIELGHVKMRFVGPGDFSEAATAATTVDTGEFEEIKGSKAPAIAIIATVLVLAIGGGGYAVLRNRTSVDPTPQPVKQPVVAVEPKILTPVADPDPSDPEAGKKALAEAQKALDSMDLAGAEAALKACTITNGGPCPETAPMQALIADEKHHEASLKAAESALERQDTTTARAMLDAANGSKVFETRVAALESKYKTASAAAATAAVAAAAATAAAAAKKIAVVAPPVPAVPVPAAGVNTTIERLTADARGLIKDQPSQAIEKLKSCLKLDANNLACIRLRASAHANLAVDGNPEDKKKAYEYYNLYLRVAPADDRYREKIQKILEDAQ